MRMCIYVASSWRNAIQPLVVKRLRAAGYIVYDFKNPAPNSTGFHWSEIDPNWLGWEPKNLIEALNTPLAEQGFTLDYNAMKAADACVLVLPSGRSAHLELGWMAGAQKFSAVLLDDLRYVTPGHDFESELCKACYPSVEKPYLNLTQCKEKTKRLSSREPELMYKLANLITPDLEEVIKALHNYEKEKRNA